ncbi:MULTISPECIES: S8 family serine peptidase [unclassified Pseudomonas]|uniref:S8 family serine peptidase n=1 Tax=unclassified Pseudomonas TaxID=196821 RepID=UPI0021158D39|nr:MULTISPECIES: S8 family serine peptidase [unclassified Pseudomonas]
MNMINMTAEQLSEVERLRQAKRYPQMYQYLRGLVAAQRRATTAPSRLKDMKIAENWLSVATSINANDGNFSNEMVRGSMQFAAAAKQRPLTDAQFQKASDDLAEKVGQHIRDSRGVPPIGYIIREDVKSAVEGLNLENWNWAGTVADALPTWTGGLGRDFVQISGDGPEYAKNLIIATMQNAAGLSRYLSSFTEMDIVPAFKYARELERYAADNRHKVFQWFGAGDNTPAQPDVNQSIQIHIDTSPKPQQRIQGEDQARQDVANGYVLNAATHNVFALGGILNNTDFASTQMASLTSGGIRPGEMQLDPNARPNSHLSKFYKNELNLSSTNLSLRNAVTLNALSAMTTFNTFVDPLLLDLGGDGARMTDLSDAVLFDTDHSGTLKRTAWADRRTGMLVIDDGSGQIKDVSQMFSEYYKGKTGIGGTAGEARFKNSFAALASEDSNGDGVIDDRDPIWNQLRVWVDASHDAKVDGGELKTLTELGITQINVRASSTPGETRDGSRVLARGSFVIGGASREVLAVDFLGEPVSSTTTRQGNGIRVVSTCGDVTTIAYSSTNSNGEHLDATALGVNNLYGGSGDDQLTAAADGSWLVGGGGSDTYIGGIGDDVFVISASDDPRNIHGNGGRNTALIVGDRGVTLNMAEAGLTIAQAGRGDDVIRSGGSAGVFIKGGEGHATLIGGAGNDVLVGGSGHNTLIGGNGKAVIYAGPQGDLIYASAGGSIIYAGGGNDVIHGGAGNDVIEVGHGNARIDGGGGTNLVSLHGKYGEYRITRTNTGYQVADSLPGRDGTVQLRNIQKLNFSDISSVDLSQPHAMPVADFLRQDKDGQRFDRRRTHLIAAASLLANDLLLGSKGGLRIDNVGDATGGSVSLTGHGDILFTPKAGYTGMMSFKYGIIDAQGNKSASAVDLSSGQSAPMRASVTLRSTDMPDDPLVSQQWYLSDTNVLPVWRDYTGKGVRIAMFEPGGQFATAPEIFDIQHPDLAANVDQTWLKTQRDKEVLPELASNHSTMVAGVMVAARNDTGGVGVAPDAKLSGYYLANSGNDLTNLGNMVNHDIANHSWDFEQDFAISNLQNGTIDTATSLAANARYAAHNGRGGLGTVIVTAGGNQRAHGGSAQGSLTNNNRFSIQVGAINAQSDLSTLQIGSTPFSNPGASLLVSAPGSNVLSTSRRLETERGSTFGDDYTSMQGTSFAAPIISGVVALMLEANPNLGYRDVQQILALSAHQVNDRATRWDDNAAHNWNGGGMHISHDYGFGEVDARAAVRLAESWMVRSTGSDEIVFSAHSGVLGKSLTGGANLNNLLQMDAGLSIEHVEVDLDATVGRLGDLIVTLISPQGTRSILLDRAGKVPEGMQGASETDRGSHRSGAFKYSFMSNRDRAEHSAGTWTLKVMNAADGLPLTLNSWTLRLYGSKATDDDTYYYTDEYLKAVQNQADRGVLDDPINGTAGGRNTLNAAAVSDDTQIDLLTGRANIGGGALIIRNPGNLHNIITGEGNDTLVAGNIDALLNGGRGDNRLTGGNGKDFFVVHRREGGQDTLHRFEPAKGEIVCLVGFTGKTFADLKLQQQGNDVRVELGNGQHILLSGQSLQTITAANFQFQEHFVAPAHYVSSTQIPMHTNDVDTVVLNGGAQGVSMASGPDGQLVASLAGKVYSHDSATSDRFVIAHQTNASDYRNALRGFRHGIDKIDLSQVGVTRFEELNIVQNDRGTINGLSQIHGVELSTTVLRGADQPVKLIYIDAIEVAQLNVGDFIFATQHLPMETTQPTSPHRLLNPDLTSPSRDPRMNDHWRDYLNHTAKVTLPSRPPIEIPNFEIPTVNIPRPPIREFSTLEGSGHSTVRPAQPYQLVAAGMAWSAGALSGLFGTSVSEQAPLYQVTLADGSPLPAWMTFDPVQATLSGTPEAGLSTNYDLKVNAGSQANAMLHLIVQPTVLTVPTFQSVTLTDDQVAVDLSNPFTQVSASGGRHIVLIGSGGATATLLGEEDQTVIATGSRAQVTLGNGNNTVKGGVSKLMVGDGDNQIDNTATFASIKLGRGHNTVIAHGTRARVEVGDSQTDIEFRGVMGSLSFGEDVMPDQLWFKRKDDDLLVSRIGTAQQVIVHNWYASSSARPGDIIAGNGRRLAERNVENLVQAMAPFTLSTDISGNFHVSQAHALQPVLAANWY